MSAIAALWTDRELKAMDPDVRKRIEAGFAYAKTQHDLKMAREIQTFNQLLREDLIKPSFEDLSKAKSPR